MKNVVYCMTNALEYNEIIAYEQHNDGTLSMFARYRTGGRGTGKEAVDPLASQGSIIISKDGHWLFVVNAGDHSISSFEIMDQGHLILVDIVSSGGIMPNSLALYEDLLYVTNSGNINEDTNSNITGFHVSCYGTLCPISCATYGLSTPTARPSCIVFHPSGKYLVVSELSTNRLTVYPVHCDGTLKQAIINNSNGAGPFGSLYLERDVLLVCEAGIGALSSYKNNNAELVTISDSIGNNQTATCWISVNKNQQVAYTSNAGTDTISIYNVYQDGSVVLRDNILSNPNGTAAPLDSAVNKSGTYFYVLNGNEGSISVFRIELNGDLSRIQVLYDTDLPRIGAQGLAVR